MSILSVIYSKDGNNMCPKVVNRDSPDYNGNFFVELNQGWVFQNKKGKIIDDDFSNVFGFILDSNKNYIKIKNIDGKHSFCLFNNEGKVIVANACYISEPDENGIYTVLKNGLETKMDFALRANALFV